jgi:hypothetical protein
MRKGIVPLDWKLIGAMCADEGSVAQLEFFKSFLNEMRSWGTNFQIEVQLCEIAGELEDADRRLLSIFCDQHGDD